MHTIKKAKTPWGSDIIPTDFGTLQVFNEMNGGIPPVYLTREVAESIKKELIAAGEGRWRKHMVALAEKNGGERDPKTITDFGMVAAYEIIDASKEEIAAWNAHNDLGVSLGRPAEADASYESGNFRVV